MKPAAAYVRRHHIALLALFVALGGTSYAAVRLPKNSVGAAQLKSSAVSSSKVKDGSLLGKDFRAGELPAGPRGTAGANGLNGTNGANGKDGPQGVPGPTASTFVSHDPSNASPQVLVMFSTTQTQVMALDDGVNGGRLVLPFAGRVLVQASLTIDNFDERDHATCRIKIAAEGGAYEPIGVPSIATVPVSDTTQLGIVAAADRPAGSYNVQAACNTQTSSVDMRFLRGNMTVVATARP